MPALSLCMIVRDEQRMLPGFLEAAAGLWDELVAVDTGSRDGTPDILRRAGARVFGHRWTDDFAVARNASLRRARGDWILFLDADERVTPDLRAQIRGLLQDGAAGAATLVMRNEWPDGRTHEADLLRLFRNDPAIAFRHRIHEDPSESVGAYLRRSGLVLRRMDGVALHLGYVRETAAAGDKHRRDLRLLKAAVAEDPEDFYSWFKLMELSRFWNDRDTWAWAAGEAARRLPPRRPTELKQEPWSGEFAALTAQGLHADAPAALAWLQGSAGWARTTAAWHLRRGMWLEESGRLQEAGRAYRDCLDDPRPPGGPGAQVRPLLGLCRLAVAGKDAAQARALAERAAALCPTDQEALLAATALATPGQAADFVRAHLDAHPAARLPLARALLLGGRAELACEVLAAAVDGGDEAALGLLVCALACDRDVDLRIDLSPAAAEGILREWISLLRRSGSARHLGAFARNAAAVHQAFPWLAAHLQETLSPSDR